jgi:hypothetical protein
MQGNLSGRSLSPEKRGGKREPFEKDKDAGPFLCTTLVLSKKL